MTYLKNIKKDDAETVQKIRKSVSLQNHFHERRKLPENIHYLSEAVAELVVAFYFNKIFEFFSPLHNRYFN